MPGDCSQYWGGLFVCFAFTEQYPILFLHFKKTIANEEVHFQIYSKCFPKGIFQALKSYWYANGILT